LVGSVFAFKGQQTGDPVLVHATTFVSKYGHSQKNDLLARAFSFVFLILNRPREILKVIYVLKWDLTNSYFDVQRHIVLSFEKIEDYVKPCF